MRHRRSVTYTLVLPTASVSLSAAKEVVEMKMRALLASVLLVGLVGFSAATATADPNLNDVPPHRHWIALTSGERVEVGPNVCDNPNLQRAFNQFHNNLHAVTPSGIGPAAPGLHNFTGGEITFTGC
jgi:hypothetical protein